MCRGGRTKSWPSDDDCTDFWEIIADHLLTHEPGYHEAKWMPGHLDSQKKKQELDKFMTEGGDPAWISGNVGADRLANEGANLLSPPIHLLVRERLRIAAARTFHRMG